MTRAAGMNRAAGSYAGCYRVQAVTHDRGGYLRVRLAVVGWRAWSPQAIGTPKLGALASAGKSMAWEAWE